MPQKNDLENPVDSKNPSAVSANDLLNGETGKNSYVNSGTDQAGSYANDPANATGANIDSIKNQEEQQGLWNPSKTQKSPRGAKLWIRKRAAMIGITTILGGAGLASTFFAGPALLLVQIKEVLTNYSSASSRAADTRNNETMYYRLKNVGSTESACRGTGAISSVRCKRGTMSEKNVQTLKDKGFAVESKVVGGRHVVSTITDPDGTQMKGTRESIRTAMAKPSFASRMKSAINPKTLVHNGSRFTSKVLKPLGLDKSAIKVEGGTDEERKESLNKLSGAADEDTREKSESKFRSQHEGKIKAVGKITPGPAAVTGIGCSAYNMTRVSLTAVKLYNMARYASLAMLFLKAADQIKSNGAIDPTTVALLGGVLTSYATSGPTKGLTATDSQGYKTAAYGGEGKLSSFTQRFMLGGNQKLIDIENSVKAIQEGYPGNKKGLAATCGVATDPVAGAAFCTLSGAGGGAAGTAVAPVLGTIGGAIAGVSVCVAGSVAGSLAAGAVIGQIFSWALPRIIDALTDAPIDANKIKGVEAGDATAAGAGYINERANLSRGMQPGTKESVTSFNSGTQESADADLAAEKYMARSDPFDVYNEHSFFGSFVRNSGLINAKPLSPSFIGSLFSTATLVPVVSAAGSMPVNITTKDLDHCPDDNLKDIGVDCDAVGGTQYVMNAFMDVEFNLNFMVGTHVDEEGNPVSESYTDWVKSCTEQRTDPIGMTSVGIESEDGWTTGEACVFDGSEIDQNTRDHFSAYYFDSAAQEDEEHDPTAVQTGGIDGGTRVRVATFNVLGASHDNDPNRNLTGEKAWDKRIERSLKVIQDNKLEVIGFQELEPRQAKYLDQNLPNFERSTKGKESDEIMWNTDRFSKVSDGTWQTSYFSKTIEEPWVKLSDNSTGQQFYIMNAHDPSNNGGSNGSTRAANVKKHLEKIQELQQDAPVFIVGDFNTGFAPGENSGVPNVDGLAYCVFTKAGMTHAFDAATKREVKCPNPSPGSEVDHIFATKEVQFESYDTTPEKGIDPPYLTRNGSDNHKTIFADGVIPGTGSASTSAGTDFVLATYNQPVRGNETVAANAIKNRKFDVVGMQELSRENYANIKRQLKPAGFSVFPDVNKQRDTYAMGCSSDHAIFYNNTKFKLIKSELVNFPRYDNYKASDCNNNETKPQGTANAPVIWLEDQRPQYKGQVIIVMNTHNVAGAGSAAQNRFRASRIYVQNIQRIQSENPGVPMFLTGDFNEGTAVRGANDGANRTWQWEERDGYKNLLYCMFAENKLMQAVGKPNTCPNPQGRTPVDFIYHTPGVKVESHNSFMDQSTNDSPHPVEYARLVVPGTGASGGKVAWPVPGVSQMGVLGYGERGSKGIHKGIDIGISGGGALGKTVVATHTGVIDRVWGQSDSCGAYVSLRVTGKSYFAAYQHLDGSSISVKQGDNVTAGQPIAKIGRQGGSTCGSSEFYHLHYSIEPNAGSVSAYSDGNGGLNGTQDPLKILPKP